MFHLSIIHEVLPMGYHCKNHSFYSLALKSIFQLLKPKEMEFLIERNLGLLFERNQ